MSVVILNIFVSSIRLELLKEFTIKGKEDVFIIKGNGFG